MEAEKRTKKVLNWWCDRAWIKFSCAISVIMTGLILWNWENWSTESKVIAAIGALIPVHVLEEWVFPFLMIFPFQGNLTAVPVSAVR